VLISYDPTFHVEKDGKLDDVIAGIEELHGQRDSKPYETLIACRHDLIARVPVRGPENQVSRTSGYRQSDHETVRMLVQDAFYLHNMLLEQYQPRRREKLILVSGRL